MSLSKVENLLNPLLAKILNETLKVSEAHPQLKAPLLEYPKEETFGNISTSIALKLASVLKRPPRVIAQEIVSALNKEIPDSELKGPFAK